MDEKTQGPASAGGFEFGTRLSPYLKGMIVIAAAAVSWGLILSFSRLAEAVIR